MRKVSLSICVIVGLSLVGCAGSDLSENSNSQADAGVEATEGGSPSTTESSDPESIDLEVADESVVEETTSESLPDAPEEDAVEDAAEEENAETEEPEEAESAEVEETEAIAEPVSVLPEIAEITFQCRSSRLTAEVHAKIPGTQQSEGRYNWGVQSITAFRKNDYGNELDHEMKWDGAYDPQKDKWVSADSHISGARYKDVGETVRFLIEGQDANGNDVSLSVTENHGTNC